MRYHDEKALIVDSPAGKDRRSNVESFNPGKARPDRHNFWVSGKDRRKDDVKSPFSPGMAFRAEKETEGGP